MENKVFYRLYQDESVHIPQVRAFTKEEEEKVPSDKFATPYRYANEEQAERAMVSYVRITLSMMGVRVL